MAVEWEAFWRLVLILLDKCKYCAGKGLSLDNNMHYYTLQRSLPLCRRGTGSESTAEGEKITRGREMVCLNPENTTLSLSRSSIAPRGSWLLFHVGFGSSNERASQRVKSSRGNRPGILVLQ